MVKKGDAFSPLRSLTLIDSSYRHASVSEAYAQTFGKQPQELVGGGFANCGARPASSARFAR